MDKVRNFLSFSPGPTYTITGNYSYSLDVSIKGDGPYQTSTISITAFAKHDKKIAIAISCKWSRIHEDRQYLLATIHSNTYQLSAEDIGYTLKIEVTPLEEDQKGIAIVNYGPIRLDPNVRSTLENILAAGGSRFPIQLVDEDTGLMSREPAAIAMTSEYVRIVETPPVGKEREIKFRYSYNIPKVELNYLDGTRLYFLFTGEEEDCDVVKKFLNVKKGVGCKLGVKLLSRTARDLLILSLKCFGTRSYLAQSVMINNAVFTPGKIFKDKKDGPQQIGDTLLEVDSIKREMYLVLLRNQELGKDKERFQHSVKRLEEELSSTIETYSQLINQLRGNNDLSQTEENAVEYKQNAERLEEDVKTLRRRVQELEDERLLGNKSEASINKGGRNTDKAFGNYGKKESGKYHDEMEIKKDFENLSAKKEDPNLFSLEYEMKLHDIQEENERLKSKNESLMEELRNAKTRESLAGTPTKMGMTLRSKASVNDESLFVIENKLSDTKKLNELLIKQVNDQKGKNSSLQKELDMLRSEVSRLRNSENGIQEVKEKSYKEAKEALDGEIQHLKEENAKLHKEKASSVSTTGSLTGRERSAEGNSELMRRIEELQRENSELKIRGSNYSALNMSQEFNMNQGGLRTPIKGAGGPGGFNSDSKRLGRVEEEFTVRFQTEMENLRREATEWRAKSTGLELELDKMKRDYSEASNKLAHFESQRALQNSSGVLMSPSSSGYMDYFNKSVANSSRTYELLLGDSRKENDRLYGEAVGLKSKITVLEYNLNSTKGELERARSSGSAYMGIESDILKVKRETDVQKEANERLKAEINSLKMEVSKQGDRESILNERDQLKAEIESLRRTRGDSSEKEAKIKQLEGRIAEQSREIDVIRAEGASLKTKSESLMKENEYLRNEVNSLRRSNESMMNMSGLLGQDSEYKSKYERLQEDYSRLGRDYNALKTKTAVGKENSEGYDDVQQMNELLRKEVLEYKKKVEELEGTRRSVRNMGENAENTEETEMKKRNRMLEFEVQNQRKRISDLEKENEKLKVTGSLRDVTNDDSFLGSSRGRDDNGKMKDEIAKLKRDNESLVEQRNQLSKKAESLGKELESKVGAKTSQAMLENLAKTNERLIQENLRLMDQVRALSDELEGARYGSRLDNSQFESSRYDDGEGGGKERIRMLQQELNMVNAEKDQLLVELSKLKVVDKGRRIFA